MTKFNYNNGKNVNTSYKFFELNCKYHPQISYQKDVNVCSKSKSANKLLEELIKLMIVYKENFYYA